MQLENILFVGQLSAIQRLWQTQRIISFLAINTEGMNDLSVGEDLRNVHVQNNNAVTNNTGFGVRDAKHKKHISAWPKW